MSVNIYPINSLGAEYIHSNAENFEATVKTTKELDNIDDAFKILKDELKKYIQMELDFYEKAEAAFIAQIKKNVENIPKLKNKLKDRDSILEFTRKEFKKEQKRAGSAIKKLVAAKDQILLWQMGWYKKWYENQKKTKGETKLNSNQFKRYANYIPKIIEGLLAAIEIISLEESQNVFNMYAKVKFEKETKKLKGKKQTMIQIIQKIIGSKEKIQQLETLAKQGITQDNLSEILFKLTDIIGDVYNEIHRKFGLLSEDFNTTFINNFLSFLTDGKASVVGANYKPFSVMDVQLMTVKVEGVQEVEIGFSQKFTKKMSIRNEYTNIDVFDVMSSYAKAKEETKLMNTIENKKPYIMYLRRNILALESFNLKKDSLSHIVDPFNKLEKELALIRGFTRFFNQFLTLSETGEIIPFAKWNVKNILGYNSLMVFKQNIFWMKDFIQLAYDSIDNNVVDGKWGSKSDFFSGEANLGNLKKSKPKLGKLWNKKLKTLREFEKNLEKITYSNLLSATESEIKKIFRNTNVKLVDSMTYKLDASKFTKQ